MIKTLKIIIFECFFFIHQNFTPILKKCSCLIVKKSFCDCLPRGIFFKGKMDGKKTCLNFTVLSILYAILYIKLPY